MGIVFILVRKYRGSPQNIEEGLSQNVSKESKFEFKFNSNVDILYIYAYMYEKEMKHYRNGFEISVSLPRFSKIYILVYIRGVIKKFGDCLY